MHIFYTPLIQPDHQHFLLDEEESKHAIRVLRLQLGDTVVLVDGKGHWFDATIQDNHPKRVVLRIDQVKPAYGKRSSYLHIAMAPTKNIERFEWFLEKATEIGVDEITPLWCDHSERKEIKVDRLQKIIIAAMKQSQKAFLPKLNPMIRLNQFLEIVDLSRHTKFIAHCEDEEKVYLSHHLQAGDSACILIGPEGDFSQQEITSSKAAGFRPTSLGNSRLRTETAGIVATLEVQLLNR